MRERTRLLARVQFDSKHTRNDTRKREILGLIEFHRCPFRVLVLVEAGSRREEDIEENIELQQDTYPKLCL